MEGLNYHHLLYFWTVAREGSIARACKKLHLAQPTISGQLRSLEDQLGERLFARVGRGLVLTEIGRMVYGYADEIFSLGRELTDVLKGRPRGRPIRLQAGVSDTIPKLIAYRILAPALAMDETVLPICHENRPERLLAELSSHHLDVVLTDAPVNMPMRTRVFNHLLGSCCISLFAAQELAARYRKNFPQCLDGAPFLLPMENSTLRRSLEQWFDTRKIRPQVAGEFQDSALLNVFGQAGAGIFAGPSAIENEVRDRHRVAILGRVESIIESFYAITAERRLKHPAVVAIADAARQRLFAPSPDRPAPPARRHSLGNT